MKRSKVQRIEPQRDPVDTRQRKYIVGERFTGAVEPVVRTGAVEDGLAAVGRATARELGALELNWRPVRTALQLEQMFPIENTLDDWLTGATIYIDDIPKELRRLHAEATLQVCTLVRSHPDSERAWALAEAYPFLLLQSWEKFTGKGASLKQMAYRFVRFMNWEIGPLLKEAMECRFEN